MNWLVLHCNLCIDASINVDIHFIHICYNRLASAHAFMSLNLIESLLWFVFSLLLFFFFPFWIKTLFDVTLNNVSRILLLNMCYFHEINYIFYNLLSLILFHLARAHLYFVYLYTSNGARYGSEYFPLTSRFNWIFSSR